MGELDGKVAIVTGAGRLRGIGRATAVALARLGADVAITGTGRDPATFPRDEKAISWRDVESTAQQVRELGKKSCHWYSTCVTPKRSTVRFARPWMSWVAWTS